VGSWPAAVGAPPAPGSGKNGKGSSGKGKLGTCPPDEGALGFSTEASAFSGASVAADDCFDVTLMASDGCTVLATRAKTRNRATMLLENAMFDREGRCWCWASSICWVCGSRYATRWYGRYL
jgi:hypothetical protein